MFKLIHKGLKVIWQGFQLQGMEQAGQWTAAEELRQSFRKGPTVPPTGDWYGDSYYDDWSKQC